MLNEFETLYYALMQWQNISNKSIAARLSLKMGKLLWDVSTQESEKYYLVLDWFISNLLRIDNIYVHMKLV